MRRFLFVTIFLLYSSGFSQTVTYRISFDNAVHHEARVTVTWSGITAKVLEARMSRSSPGRYALHEFAKNIYDVSAKDGKGRSLAIVRPDPYQWNIGGHDGTVVLTYTVFGDRVDGTYLGIDRTHAHLNIPAMFMWARGMDHRPISVTFDIPKNSHWKAATQLMRTKDAMTYTAPDLQYFMDSPVELSDFQSRRWTVERNDTTATFILAVHSNDSASYLDAYAVMAQAVLAEHEALWGRFAPYDAGEYTFIADYLPTDNGDGMEHRNSTVITSSLSLQKSAVRLLGTVSHEFFHSWNVERIRPRSLEPFNFEQANMSGELWFAEGFTSYYGPLLEHRAGITSVDEYAKTLSRLLTTVLDAPGTRYFSAVEMSEHAPFADAATSIDVTNNANTYLSYYDIGAAIALDLDLTVRERFPGMSLDDLMRSMRAAHRDVATPYTLDDLRKTLGGVVKDQTFADEFFRRFVEGHEFPDYAALLDRAGFVLRSADSGTASMGYVPLSFEKGKTVVSGGTMMNTAAYAAGIDRGDTIISMDGMTISSRKDIDTVMHRHHPGQSVTVVFIQRGERRESSLKLQENMRREVVPYEWLGKKLTPEQTAFRRSWLGKKSDRNFPDLVKYCPTCKRRYDFTTSFCPLDGAALSIVP